MEVLWGLLGKVAHPCSARAAAFDPPSRGRSLGRTASGSRPPGLLPCLLALFLQALLPEHRVLADSLIVPREAAQAQGSSRLDTEFFIQTVYAAENFSTADGDILAISGLLFRWDDGPTRSPALFYDLTIGLGTFPKPLDRLDISYYTANRGADYQTVLRIQYPSLIPTPSLAPVDFGFGFTFAKPFQYDRRAGHLLFEFSMLKEIQYEPFPGGPWLDLLNDIDTQSAYSAVDLRNPSAGGLPVRFLYTVVPEPSACALLILGTLALSILARLRRP